MCFWTFILPSVWSLSQLYRLLTKTVRNFQSLSSSFTPAIQYTGFYATALKRIYFSCLFLCPQPHTKTVAVTPAYHFLLDVIFYKTPGTTLGAVPPSGLLKLGWWDGSSLRPHTAAGSSVLDTPCSTSEQGIRGYLLKTLKATWLFTLHLVPY